MNKYKILVSAWVAALLLTSCEKTEPCSSGAPRPATIRVTAAPMTIVGKEVPYDTRASQPLFPEHENVIYSLAVLVFDKQEALLHAFDDGRYYKYINLKDANGNGVLNTELSTAGFPVLPGQEYTVCLIANLPETTVRSIIEEMMTDGSATLGEFKNISVQIPYVAETMVEQDRVLESGHVRAIYMFGFYEGDVSSHSELSITLGRIISRLEVAMTIDPSVEADATKQFYIRLENLESHAHLFPVGKSPGRYEREGIYPISDSELQTIYFYSAPNSALTEEQALRLRMWYADKGLSEEAVQALPANAVIYLCNDQPGISDRNYQLNRNSVYRFNINLTKKQ